MNTIEKIINFLNVPEETIGKCNPDLLAKLIKAARDEDFFKVHQLGYLLKENEK